MDPVIIAGKENSAIKRLYQKTDTSSTLHFTIVLSTRGMMQLLFRDMWGSLAEESAGNFLKSWA